VLVAVINLVRIIKNKHLYVAYQKEHIAQPQQTALATAGNTQQKALVPTDNTVYNTATLRQDFITYVPPVQVAKEQPEEEQQAEQLAEQQEQPQEEQQEQQEQLADTQQEEQPMKEEKEEDKAVLVAEQPQEEKPKKAPAKKATTKKATTTKKAEPKDKEAKEVTKAKAQEAKPKKTTTKKATTSTTTAKKSTTKKAETANAEPKKATTKKSTTTKAEPKKSTATTKKAKQPAPDPEEIKEIIKEVKTKSRKEVTAKEVNTLLPDVVAKAMVQNESTGKKYYHKDIINVDTLSANFESGATVNLESLKQKGLIANNVDAVKVLARGTLTKKLTVELQDFSIEAVKMILLTGGEARKV
jgi:predicted transcriptional regulator